MGRVLRLTVLGALGALVACGSFLAADKSAAPGDGGDGDGPDAEPPDGSPGSDAGSSADGARDAASGRCRVDRPFGAPAEVPVSLSPNVHAVRIRGDEVYFAFTGSPGKGVELGAAPVLPDGGVGPAHLTWFTLVNGDGGQTMPAPAPDGLDLVYQEDKASALRITTRTAPDVPFGAAGELTIIGGFDGTPVDPYFTSEGDLFFATDEGVVHQARLDAAKNAKLVRALGELGNAAHPVVSDDGLEIFFTRLGDPLETVYHATRSSPSGVFGIPVEAMNLSTELTHTRPTWISPDRCQLLLLRTEGTNADGPRRAWYAERN